ncbi:MAG: hypothetical protein QOF60_3383, partial [Actinomycetota bacterium]|nr:hypothetical protein [Actinomycetota bacterium]
SDHLAVRLELGLPEELADLGALLGTALNRGDYLRLLEAGLTSVESLRDRGLDGLADLLGADAANRVGAIVEP